MRTNPLVGKKITAAFLAEDGMALRFDVEGDKPIVVKVDADCCSHTWIEYIETPENLLGVVTSVENVDMPDKGSPNDYEVIAYYGCKITTDKGSTLLDYRNESNGYYGGSLSWPDERSYFYGGVFGQNVSEEKWKQIA